MSSRDEIILPDGRRVPLEREASTTTLRDRPWTEALPVFVPTRRWYGDRRSNPRADVRARQVDVLA